MADTTASKLMRSGAFRVAHTALATVVGFFMMPFYVSHLGEHWYGIWLTIGSLVANYYLLDVGLAGAVTRNIAEGVAREDSLLVNQVANTALSIYLGIAGFLLLVTGVLAACAPLIVSSGDSDVIRQLIAVTGITFAINFPFNAFSGIIQARVRYDLLSFIQLGTLILTTVVTVAAILHGMGVLTLAYVGLGSALVTNYMFLHVARGLYPDLKIDPRMFDRTTARHLFGYSMWSFAIQMAEQLRARVDPLIVAGTFSPAMVTRYSVGSRPVGLASEFLYRATNFVTPVLTRLHVREDKARLQRALDMLVRINVILMLFVAGMLVAVGEPFIERWMGPGFQWSVLVLYALVPARAIEFILSPLDSALYATAQHRLLAITVSIEAVLKLAGSFALIRYVGPMGVALGTSLATVLVRVFITAPMSCRLLGIRFREFLAKQAGGVLSASSLMVLATYVAWTRFTLRTYVDLTVFVTIAAMFYMPIMLFTGLSADDRAELARGLPQRWIRRPTERAT